ncbi:MAG TPA: ABC transporter permease [Vicinamibacterales bacterium]|nr:ABC transporter permease [Vicinamibacterales bacterium]
MEVLLQDIRYGCRTIAKSPGFAAIATLTLALGIGASTALFSVVNGVLLNPLPYAQPNRLVAIYTRSKEFKRSSISYPNFLDWARDQQAFTGIAAFRQDDFTLTEMGEPERLKVEMVSANFFSLLGIKPVIGRLFRSDEDVVGAQPVVLISGGLWARQFASSPDVLGRTLVLDGTGYTVAGVIPGDFQYQSGNFHENADLYVPIGQWNDPTFRRRDTGMGMDAVGRLKPGVTLEQAQSAMNAIAAHLAQTYPDADKGSGITLIPLKQDVVGRIRPFLLVLLAAVGFVLLIACVNVANLLLARSTGRTREFAIRAALGAGRGRVIRQLLTESALLACAGGVLGILLAAWGTRTAIRLLPEALPRTQGVQIDGRVLLFSLGASLLAGILFGLAPALKTSRTDVHDTLKEGGRGGSGVRHRTQTTFVIVEVALALVLLVGAGLMIRTLAKLWSVNPGFDPHDVVTFAVSYPAGMGSTPDAIRASMRQLQSKIASVPGVEAASLSGGAMPMAGDSEMPFWIEGQPKPSTEAEMKTALFYGVSPSYFKAMGIPLERGRFLTSQDDEHGPFVIDIDQEFARLYFPGRNPIGQHVHFAILNQTATIVGVVGHVKQWGLDENAASPVLAQFYFPVVQMPDRFLPLMARGSGVVVRTRNAPAAEMGAIRHAIDGLHDQVVMYGAETMDAIIARSLAARRFSMMLLGVFAALALVLASIGLYGVISYLVGQRTHEIGIRLALGAQKRDILRLILGQGTRMALIGVGVGLAGSLALMRLMGTLLYGVSASDPLTFAAVAGLLILVAVAACYVPARRAMRVDQMVALRYE